jgi:hypothetical protein
VWSTPQIEAAKAANQSKKSHPEHLLTKPPSSPHCKDNVANERQIRQEFNFAPMPGH